jgi:S-(hydroxymethyl)glutathione dehydrogenase/alcohol dehydrogenase
MNDYVSKGTHAQDDRWLLYNLHRSERTTRSSSDKKSTPSPLPREVIFVSLSLTNLAGNICHAYPGIHSHALDEAVEILIYSHFIPYSFYASIYAFQLVTGRVWKGCAFGGVKGRSQMGGLIDDYLGGKLKVDEFITHRQNLGGINDAFHDMHAGDCIRCVVDMKKL